jgi:transcriptional regulator
MAKPANPHHHMTYSEVAEVLGVSRQTIKVIERKAFEKLKNNKQLREYWHGLIAEEGGINRASDILDSNGASG